MDGSADPGHRSNRHRLQSVQHGPKTGPPKSIRSGPVGDDPGPIWVALFLGEYPTPLVTAGFITILIGMYRNSKITQKDLLT